MMGTFLRGCMAALGLAFILSCGGGADLAATGAGVTVTVSPASLDVLPGEAKLFQAKVMGTTNGAVTWTASAGTITAGGLFTAPSSPGKAVVVATSVADASKSGAAEVTVTTAPQRIVKISPTNPTVTPGDVIAFSASVVDATGTPFPDQGVTWAVMGAATSTSNGTIDPRSGFYTAPQTPGIYMVTATPTADTSRLGTAQVTVAPPPAVSISLSPKQARIAPGTTLAFSADVQGSANKTVTWTVLGGAANGTFLGGSGIYQAPDTPGTFTVMTTAAADQSRFDTATIQVTYEVLPIAVIITPDIKSLQPNTTFTFMATVTGTSQTGVNWRVDSGPGSIDSATGTFTAPSGAATTVIRATSKVDPGKFALATVTTTQSRVDITPVGPQKMIPGSVGLFKAVVYAPDGQVAGDQRVDWAQVLPAPTDPLRTASEFLYTAPTSTNIAVIRAIAVSDPSAFRDVPIEVTASAFQVSPSYVLVGATRSVQFRVTHPEVTWKRVGTAGGTVDAVGLYQAPLSIGGALQFLEDTVTATYNPNPSVSASARVLVTPLLVLPERITLSQGASQTFTASLYNGNSQAVTWTASYWPPAGQPEDVTNLLTAASATSVTLTAPPKAGTYRIRAIPASNPSYYGEAEIIVP